jgi:hypothetical protein
MASSYSDLGLELMVTGENAGTWGDKTNSNLNLIQQAVGGYEAITLTSGGTVTLAMTDAQLSTARNMIIKFATATIAASTICTIPDGIEKFYIFDCSGLTNPANLVIKTASGTGFTLNAAKIFAAYSDGTNLNEISLDTLGGTIAAADITGTISTAQIADNAVTTAKISDNQITTAKISDNQITTAKISDNQITTAKIANDAVGPDQLSNTAVTPAEYTSATITVDAQGRITAASSGAGAANMTTKLFVSGPTSGTVALDPSASKVQAYLFAGGGGSGSGSQQRSSGSGGTGGFGFFQAPATGGSTIPYSVGSGGNGGTPFPPGNPGNAGSETSFHNFTTNGGGGSPVAPNFVNGSPGSAGNAPGSTGTIDGGILFSTAKGTGVSGAGPGSSGSSGTPGGIVIFSNEG